MPVQKLCLFKVTSAAWRKYRNEQANLALEFCTSPSRGTAQDGANPSLHIVSLAVCPRTPGATVSCRWRSSHAEDTVITTTRKLVLQRGVRWTVRRPGPDFLWTPALLNSPAGFRLTDRHYMYLQPLNRVTAHYPLTCESVRRTGGVGCKAKLVITRFRLFHICRDRTRRRHHRLDVATTKLMSGNQDAGWIPYRNT